VIRIIHYTKNNDYIDSTLLVQDLPKALKNRRNLIWIDFEGEPSSHCEPILLETFDFHPLAVDDALRETHVPRIDDWGDYLYIVLHAICLDKKDGSYISHIELDVFLGEH
jgi:magnesium transporter